MKIKLKFFLAKGPDVPTYVEYGAADIGVVGKDTIVEEDATYMRYWILDSAPAECVYAGHRMPKSFWSIVR